MKKKTRNITVDGVQYIWVVSRRHDKYRDLTIWKNRNNFICVPEYGSAITPKDVEEIIRKEFA